MMGANHVSVIYATWGRILHGTAFRLLVHMALTAKDADNPPMYWAGRDGMAQALGKDDDPAGHQAVKRALSVLKREGAVKLNRAPRKGKYATRWEIILQPPFADGTSLLSGLVGSTLLALAMVSTAKHFSHTSCPWELASFGGNTPYVPHWVLGLADGGGGRCFPAGHASTGRAHAG